MIAFGGGGAMHAVALAEELMTPKVIIPVNSSVFSAWGMLMCDLRRDFLKTDVKRVNLASASEIEAGYAELEAHAREASLAEGLPEASLRIERFADMRYMGQEHTVKVPIPSQSLNEQGIAAVSDLFHVAHEREYTFKLDTDVELVNFHVVVFADVNKEPLPKLPVTGASIDAAQTERRNVDFDDAGVHDAAIYDLKLLEPGMKVSGPAVIEDPTATIVVSPGKTAEMDAYGNIHIDMRAS